MRFHIVAPNLTLGDGVSQDALGMARALRRGGFEAWVYANHRDRALRHLGEPLRRYRAGPMTHSEDVLIYHHCVSWHEGLELYTETRNQRVLKYHNITPAAYYAGLDAEYYTLCELGVEQTRALATAPAALYLADSDFNAAELRSLGLNAVRVRTMPPFHDLEELDGVQADLEVLRRFHSDRRNVLFVGRLAPNKAQIDLVRIFAHYHHYLQARSRLFLVGAADPRLHAYTTQIHEAMAGSGVQDSVIVTGKVTPAQLKAYYLLAHAFLCASKHEGFCVPLVEAMHFRIPCVAAAGTAVTGTLGRQALRWQDSDPAVLAESLNAVIENAELSDYLVEQQTRRYERRFAPAAIERRLLNCLKPLWKAGYRAQAGQPLEVASHETGDCGPALWA
jgi:glycosyltransferase involved in cell wall biosynthesis